MLIFQLFVSLHQDVSRNQPDEWPTSGSDWLRPVPWGMRGLLNWLKDEYDLPVYITENGFSDPDIPELNDEGRVTYYRSYINEALKGNVSPIPPPSQTPHNPHPHTHFDDLTFDKNCFGIITCF